MPRHLEAFSVNLLDQLESEDFSNRAKETSQCRSDVKIMIKTEIIIQGYSVSPQPFQQLLLPMSYNPLKFISTHDKCPASRAQAS